MPKKKSKKQVKSHKTFIQEKIQQIKKLIEKGHKKRINIISFKKDKDLDVKMWGSFLILSSIITVLVFLAGYNKNYFLYSVLLPNQVEKVKVQECIDYRQLDGVCITEEMITDGEEIMSQINEDESENSKENKDETEQKEFTYIERPYIAAMVENHIVSQPLSGVQEASIVFETLVEGPITRFMLVYPYLEQAKKIGPIRSARPYFVDWVKGFDALFAHVGGSPQALQDIRNKQIFDFDEFSKTNYFWRARNRKAPHNVYTSLSNLREGFEDSYKNNTINSFEPWKFKDPADEDTRSEQEPVTVNFSVEPYNVTWEYNKNENVYYRFTGREPYLDDNNYYIYSENVVILESDFKTIDEVGRRKINTKGPGKGVVLRDGKVHEISWQMNSKTLNLELLNQYNKKFALNRGKVWVQVIPSLENVNQ